MAAPHRAALSSAKEAVDATPFLRLYTFGSSPGTEPMTATFATRTPHAAMQTILRGLGPCAPASEYGFAGVLHRRDRGVRWSGVDHGSMYGSWPM
jgi:hypothetical protein